MGPTPSPPLVGDGVATLRHSFRTTPPSSRSLAATLGIPERHSVLLRQPADRTPGRRSGPGGCASLVRPSRRTKNTAIRLSTCDTKTVVGAVPVTAHNDASQWPSARSARAPGMVGAIRQRMGTQLVGYGTPAQPGPIANLLGMGGAQKHKINLTPFVF